VVCPAGFECSEIEKPKNPFFGRSDALIWGFQFSGMFVDMKTSMDGVALEGEYPGFMNGRPGTLTITWHEVSGPEEKYIRNGWGSFTLYKLRVNAPLAVASHFLRKSDKLFLKILGWALPVGMGFLQWDAGIDNWQLNRDMRDQIYRFQNP
jgi:hypothetical protein